MSRTDQDLAAQLGEASPKDEKSPSTSEPTAGLPDGIFSRLAAFPPKPGAQDAAGNVPGAALPPGMASVKQYTADEVVNLLNRTPLFMTELDETDGEGGENIELEALKALVYEGTRAEIAQNFREQGNDLAKVKRWSDAKEYYNKAIAALKAPPTKEQLEEEAGKEDEEKKKRRQLDELCYVNRALCNLELSMSSRLHADNMLANNAGRELSLVQSRLCLYPPSESSQCQGVVSVHLRLPCT
jgi:hypothetical protein